MGEQETAGFLAALSAKLIQAAQPQLVADQGGEVLRDAFVEKAAALNGGGAAGIPVGVNRLVDQLHRVELAVGGPEQAAALHKAAKPCGQLNDLQLPNLGGQVAVHVLVCPEKDLLDVVQLPLLERERIDPAERQQRHPVRSDSDGGVEAGEMTGINLLQIGAKHPPIQKRNFQFEAVFLDWVQQPLIVIRGVEVAGIGIIGGFVAQHKAGIAGFLPRIRVGAGAAVQRAAVVNR